MREKQERSTGFAEMNSLSLLREHIQVERFEAVPLALIDMSDQIISHKKVQELIEDIRKNNQKIPVYLRPRLVPHPDSGEESIIYDPMDGYHRISALLELQQDVVDAKVAYGMSDAEVYEHRFIAIHSAPEVLLRRAVRWLPVIYEMTPFAQKMSLVEALARSNSRQRMSVLTRDEEEELRVFIKRKAGQIGRSVSYMESFFRSVEGMAPDVVDLVELTMGSARPSSGMISRSGFEHLVQSYRGEENYAVQRGLARYIGEWGLLAPHVETLLKRVFDQIQPGMDADAVYQLASAVPHEDLLFSSPVEDVHGSDASERPLQEMKQLAKENRGFRRQIEALREKVKNLTTSNRNLRKEKEELEREKATLQEEKAALKRKLTRRTIVQFYGEHWEERGNCASDPDAFFRGNKQNNAAEICSGCQVRRICLATALKSGKGEQYGVWGGHTVGERENMLIERPRMVELFIADVEERHGQTLKSIFLS